MKVLMVTNKVKTYALGFQNVIEPMLELGHELIWAADFSGFIGERSIIPCKTVQIDINSNPIKTTNIRAYNQIKTTIKEECIEAVMCSTPIGGMLGRLAAMAMRIPLVIYAAHGFLFFKGAPLLNRTLFRLQEELMAPMTDVLININDEDFQAARNFKLRGIKKHYLVHGAGVKTGQQVVVDHTEKRQQIGVPDKAFVIVSAGFLNQNKNNRVIIEALGRIKDDRVHYLVCGEGELKEQLMELAKGLCLEEQVHFLGFRTDIQEIMAVSDVFVMPSFREGVPRALLEAMDLGLPCIGSRTRGIRELIGENGEGGYVCSPNSAEEFAKAFCAIRNRHDEREKMINRNREIVGEYSTERVQMEMIRIYKEVLNCSQD